MHMSAVEIFGLKRLPSYLPGQRDHPSLRSELLNLACGWWLVLLSLAQLFSKASSPVKMTTFLFTESSLVLHLSL